MAAFKLFVDNIKTDIDLHYVGNTDEVPVSFDMMGNYTMAKKGIQYIKITTTGQEKCFFTVFLCNTADGAECDPLIIIKRKTMPTENFTRDVR
jgi:hypothetical protein